MSIRSSCMFVGYLISNSLLRRWGRRQLDVETILVQSQHIHESLMSRRATSILCSALRPLMHEVGKRQTIG
jgi:hypothetical protein